MPPAFASPPEIAALPDLASRALGGSVVWCNDEFYGGADNLINPEPAVHDPAAFTARGKVYDGWETRRRREPGVDAAIVRLAAPAVLRRVDVDTSFFRGNYPPRARLEGWRCSGTPAWRNCSTPPGSR
jgi:allantoicase